MSAYASVRCLGWLIHKDLAREIRTPQTWPRSIVLGLVLVLLISTQVDLPAEAQADVIGGLLWLAVFFSGTIAIERTTASEHDGGCWQTLRLYPVGPSVLFLAKMLVNLFLILLLEVVLIPLFVVLTNVPLLARPGPLAIVVWLGGVGFAAVGTLLGALTASLPNRGALLALLLLPLAAPILISSAEATRILLRAESDPMWSWWIQVLAIFAVTFTVVGTLAFDFIMEE